MGRATSGSGTFIVARYDTCQISGQPAYRGTMQHMFNPSDTGRKDHGGMSWSYEKWIKKYGLGRRLGTKSDLR
jgi:hypothetical protein